MILYANREQTEQTDDSKESSEALICAPLFVKQCKEDGRTILYSSHSMYETEEICDKIAIIHDGRILMTDSIKHIQEEHGSLEKAFIATVKGEKSWE